MLLTKGCEHEVARNDLLGSFQKFHSLFRLSLAMLSAQKYIKKKCPRIVGISSGSD